MIDRVLLIGANHRLVAFLALVLVTVLTAPGITQLSVDTGLDSLIADSDPDRQAYLRVSEEFGSDNRTLVYVRDQDLWSVGKIAALERLQERLEHIAQVARVESILTVRTIRGSGRTLDSRPLLTDGANDQANVDRARTDALANPLIVGNFVSADGFATTLMVTMRPPVSAEDRDAEVNAALEQAINAERSQFGEIFQIGPSRINTELKTALLADLQFLAPVSAALLTLTLLLFLGSVFGALLPLIGAVLSIAWTFGLMGLLGIPLNILSAMLPSLVIVIGSTEDTHMLASYFQNVARVKDGNIRQRATRLMMRKMGVPLLLTVVTTALGFAANIVNDIEMIRHFALSATFAILANGLITILFVPLVMSLVGPKHSRVSLETDRAPGFTGLLVRILGFGRRRLAVPIMILTVSMCGFFIFQASKLYVTNDPFSYFRSDKSLIMDAQRLQTDLAGVKVFFVVLESDEDRAFLKPGNVAKLVELHQFDQIGIVERL